MIENRNASSQMEIGVTTLQSKKKRRIKSNRLMKNLFIIGIVFFSLYTTIRGIHFQSVTGTANWKESNGQRYLDVRADTNYELGYLTGQQIASQIGHLKYVLLISAMNYHTNYWEFINQAQTYLPFIPQELQDEFQGLADGASYRLGVHIDFNDILIQNCWLDLCYGSLLTSSLNPVACTAIGVKNENNTSVMGQNFDFLALFEPTLVFVKYQLGTGPSIFSLRFGGGLDLPTGKTSYGIITLGTVVRTTVPGKISMPLVCRMRMAFSQAHSAEDFKKIFYNSSYENQTFGFNLIISDNSSLFAIETQPNEIFRIDNTTLIKTNTYTNPSWQTKLADPKFSKDRQRLTELYVQNAYQNGDLTEEELFEILQKEPEICQRANKSTEVQTLAYFSNNYFGLGSPNKNQAGCNPV